VPAPTGRSPASTRQRLKTSGRRGEPLGGDVLLRSDPLRSQQYDRVSRSGPLQPWYAGRIFGFLSGSLLLFVLLYEITVLYAQLLRAVLGQRREREARLMTGDAVAATIAHEIKQPLSGMTTSADAAFRWLDRATPDLDEAKVALKQIVAAAATDLGDQCVASAFG
jgi:hypothetical protein